MSKIDEITDDYVEYLHDHLRTPEAAAGYLNAALGERDAATLLLAIRDVVEAHGVSAVAAKARLNRENLYRILSEQGNPRLYSMLALLQAVGLGLAVNPLPRREAKLVTKSTVSASPQASVYNIADFRAKPEKVAQTALKGANRGTRTTAA